jgi:hypothetical protein
MSESCHHGFAYHHLDVPCHIYHPAEPERWWACPDSHWCDRVTDRG